MMLTRLLRPFAFLWLCALPALAQDPPPPPPREYTAGIHDAVRLFGEQDYAGALAAVDRAEQAHSPTAVTFNVRGAIAIEQRRFEEGARFLQEALKLDPKYFPARFNVGELPLVQKRYPEARAIFEKLLEEYPKDELLMFRVFLCHLLEKNDTAARQALDKIPFPGDTPAYYYANAAWEYAHDNVPEAQKWIARGNWVFPKDKVANFATSLYEVGWLERPKPKKAGAAQTPPSAAPSAEAPAAGAKP